MSSSKKTIKNSSTHPPFPTQVINKLDVVTTMHWHGILQTNSPGEDGTQWIAQNPIPGALQTVGLPQPDSDPNAPQKFTYSFLASVPGTLWYHSHYEEQYADGARGALIVKAPPSLSQVQDFVEQNKEQLSGEKQRFIAPLEYEVDTPVLLFDNYHKEYTELQAWYESTATNPDGVEPVPEVRNKQGGVRFFFRGSKNKANSPLLLPFHTQCPHQRHRPRLLRPARQRAERDRPGRPPALQLARDQSEGRQVHRAQDAAAPDQCGRVCAHRRVHRPRSDMGC